MFNTFNTVDRGVCAQFLRCHRTCVGTKFDSGFKNGAEEMSSIVGHRVSED